MWLLSHCLLFWALKWRRLNTVVFFNNFLFRRAHLFIFTCYWCFNRLLEKRFCCCKTKVDYFGTRGSLKIYPVRNNGACRNPSTLRGWGRSVNKFKSRLGFSETLFEGKQLNRLGDVAEWEDTGFNPQYHKKGERERRKESVLNIKFNEFL